MPAPLTDVREPAVDRVGRWAARVGGLPRTFWVLWVGALINRLGSFVQPFLALYLTRAGLLDRRGRPGAHRLWSGFG